MTPVVLFFVLVIGVGLIPSYDDRQRIKFYNSLADCYAASEDRIQREVAAYVESHIDLVAEQLADSGAARIPTFAGDYMLTREFLEEIAKEEN